MSDCSWIGVLNISTHFQPQVLDCSQKICSRKPSTSTWYTDFQLTSINRSLLLRCLESSGSPLLASWTFSCCCKVQAAAESTPIHTGTLPRRAGLTCCWTSSHPLCPGSHSRLLAWDHLVCQCSSTPIPLPAPCPLPGGELKHISFLLASYCFITVDKKFQQLAFCLEFPIFRPKIHWMSLERQVSLSESSSIRPA